MFARFLYGGRSEVKARRQLRLPAQLGRVGPCEGCTYKLESSYTRDHHANTISQQHCFFHHGKALSYAPSWATHSARFSLAKRYASVAGLR